MVEIVCIDADTLLLIADTVGVLSDAIGVGSFGNVDDMFPSPVDVAWVKVSFILLALGLTRLLVNEVPVRDALDVEPELLASVLAVTISKLRPLMTSVASVRLKDK